METMTISDIPDDIYRGLEALAALHGRSAEAEVYAIIAAAVEEAENIAPARDREL